MSIMMIKIVAITLGTIIGTIIGNKIFDSLHRKNKRVGEFHKDNNMSLHTRTENDMKQLDMMFDDQVIRALRNIQNHWLPERPIIYGDDRMYTESQYQAEKMHQAIDDAVAVLLAKLSN